MPAVRWKGGPLLLLLAALAGSCADDASPKQTSEADTGVGSDAGPEVDTSDGLDAAIGADAGIDSGAPLPPLVPCLERPTDLPRPPSGELPCDLLPPGFSR